MARFEFNVTPLGFGAFKIGRNRQIKYPQGYDLPDAGAVETLLNAVLDMGVNYIDTAPAYGVSEERIGQAIAHRRKEFVLSTKVGETFEDGVSRHDYSAQATRDSVHRSLRRLRTEVLDLVLVHSDGRDLDILEQTDVVPTLQALRDEGLIGAVGLSGYTQAGFRAALAWADAIMVEYNLENRTLEAVIAEAREQGVAVMVKKGLASGRLNARAAIGFVLSNSGVTSLVVGGLSLDHLGDNLRLAREVRGMAASESGC